MKLDHLLFQNFCVLFFSFLHKSVSVLDKKIYLTYRQAMAGDEDHKVILTVSFQNYSASSVAFLVRALRIIDSFPSILFLTTLVVAEEEVIESNQSVNNSTESGQPGAKSTSYDEVKKNRNDVIKSIFKW